MSISWLRKNIILSTKSLTLLRYHDENHPDHCDLANHIHATITTSSSTPSLSRDLSPHQLFTHPKISPILDLISPSQCRHLHLHTSSTLHWPLSSILPTGLHQALSILMQKGKKNITQAISFLFPRVESLCSFTLLFKKNSLHNKGN